MKEGLFCTSVWLAQRRKRVYILVAVLLITIIINLTPAAEVTFDKLLVCKFICVFLTSVFFILFWLIERSINQNSPRLFVFIRNMQDFNNLTEEWRQITSLPVNWRGSQIQLKDTNSWSVTDNLVWNLSFETVCLFAVFFLNGVWFVDSVWTLC